MVITECLKFKVSIYNLTITYLLCKICAASARWMVSPEEGVGAKRFLLSRHYLYAFTRCRRL